MSSIKNFLCNQSAVMTCQWLWYRLQYLSKVSDYFMASHVHVPDVLIRAFINDQNFADILGESVAAIITQCIISLTFKLILHSLFLFFFLNQTQ